MRPPIRSQRCLRERRTRSCATNKAKLEYQDCTRFSQGVQQREVIENENPNPLDNRADRAHANLAAAWREQDKAMLDALSNADGRQQRASIDVLRWEVAERSDWPRDVRSLGSSASILIATSEPVETGLRG